MTEQPNTPTVTAVEADFFRTIMEFYTKTTTLVRQASLDDEKKKVVSERINALLDDVTAEIKRTKQWSLTEPLQVVYVEVERFVEELSGLPDGNNDKTAKPKIPRLKGKKNKP